MVMRGRFELLPEHIKLLRASWVNEQLSDGDYGAAEIDSKRPYGNKDVEMDIAEELGFEILTDRDGETHISAEVADRCNKLHSETPIALQIVLSTGVFEPGLYLRTTPYGKNWKKAE